LLLSVLEEQPWNIAPRIGELIQKEPRAGELPTERTEVTLLRDANNLYIGVMCFDPEPGKIIGTDMQRGANLSDDDRITLVLDTFRDQRSAYYFATNPSDALVDGPSLIFVFGQGRTQDTSDDYRFRAQDTKVSAKFQYAFRF
jgi:hypothetical protein